MVSFGFPRFRVPGSITYACVHILPQFRVMYARMRTQHIPGPLLTAHRGPGYKATQTVALESQTIDTQEAKALLEQRYSGTPRLNNASFSKDNT